MPARPAIPAAEAQALAALGERLRLARLRRKLSAEAVAERAGIARITLHRLEAGSPAATLGTLAQVLGALGLRGELDALAGDVRLARKLPAAELPARRQPPLPATLRLSDLPELRAAAWHLADKDAVLTPQEALALYERNWRHIDRQRMQPAEARLLQRLTRTIGKGVLLV